MSKALKFKPCSLMFHGVSRECIWVLSVKVRFSTVGGLRRLAGTCKRI